MDQSTPSAQVMDKHRSCDTSRRAAPHRVQLVPDTALPPLPPQSLGQLSTSVSTIETQRHPRTHPHALQTLCHRKHTQGPSMCLLSKHPGHTQVIDFYSSCNLLDGQKKVSQSLHTVMHSVCVSQAHLHTHTSTCIYTNRLK